MERTNELTKEEYLLLPDRLQEAYIGYKYNYILENLEQDRNEEYTCKASIKDYEVMAFQRLGFAIKEESNKIIIKRIRYALVQLNSNDYNVLYNYMDRLQEAKNEIYEYINEGKQLDSRYQELFNEYYIAACFFILHIIPIYEYDVNLKIKQIEYNKEYVAFLTKMGIISPTRKRIL